MSSTSSHRLRRGVGVGTMAVAMLALMLPAGAAAAAGRVGPTAAELAGLEPVTSGPRRCVVRHDGVSYTTLQAGVDAAEPGETVTLQGTCAGFTLVDKDVTIRGVRRERSGNPTITGQGIIPVLWVGGDFVPARLRPAGDAPGWGSIVTIVGLRIVRGFSGDDAAITLDDGAGLVLRNTIVSRHRGTENGAIKGNEENLLVLRGTTEIRRSHAIEGDGGGVDFYDNGRIELHDTSSIHHNRAWEDGGGISGRGGVDIEMHDDSAIHDNRTISDEDGGGIFVTTDGEDIPSVTLNDRARIHGNRATNDGGGVYSTEGVYLTLNDSARIESNSADDGAGVRMGSGSVLTLNDSARISRNVAADEAGGVDAYQATVTLNDASRISGNGALDDSGGGIDLYESTLTMSGSARISNNRAGIDGGGVEAYDATVSLSGNARITGNRAATGAGGGIHAGGTTITLSGTAIVELNRAADLGGGIKLHNFGSLDFNDTALVRQNISAEDGGGVYVEACITVTDLVVGTNVLSNTPNDFVQPVC